MSRPRTRILLDTNILISYLLAADRPNPVVWLVETIIARPFSLVMSNELVDELMRKVQTKPYLAKRIEPSEVNHLIEVLRPFAIWIDLGDTPHPRIVRDENDDYLIVLATLGRADVIITGDFDLLELDLPLPFRITSLTDFVAEIGDAP